MPIKRLAPDPVREEKKPQPKLAEEVPHFKAWSSSRLNDYKECPQKAEYKYLDKTVAQEPGTEAMHEGSYVDWLAEVWSTKNYDLDLPDASREGWVEFWGALAEERRATMKKDVVPVELEKFTTAFEYLRERANDLHPQDQVSLDRKWAILPPSAWFDARSGRTWLRVKEDTWWDEEYDGGRLVRRIVDFKNGKRVRDKDLAQVDLYALVELLRGAEEVLPELWYLKLGLILPEEKDVRVYTPDDIPTLKRKWEKESKAMLADRTFEPKVGRHCDWCFFNSKNGGPCNAQQEAQDARKRY